MTRECARAVREVADALRAIDGTRGLIQICQPSWLGPHYVYGAVVARAERHEATGAIVWRDEPNRHGSSPRAMSPAVMDAIGSLPVRQRASGSTSPRPVDAVAGVPEVGGLPGWV